MMEQKIIHLGEKIIYEVSLFISYFKIKSKLTFIYFFIIISDISAMRADLLSFFAITIYMMMIIIMNAAADFFAVRAPRAALFQ